MEDNERDEILYRVDERTEIMGNQLNTMESDLKSHKKELGRTKDLAQDNRMILNGMTFGLSTIIATGLAQIMGLLKF